MSECKFKVGDVVKNGYGDDVRIIAIRRHDTFPIVALVGKNENVGTFRKDGSMFEGGTSESDLIPPKRVVYLSFPKYDVERAYVHGTKDVAEASAKWVGENNYIAIAVPVELPG